MIGRSSDEAPQEFSWSVALLSFLLPPLGQAVRGYPLRAVKIAAGLACLPWLIMQVAVFLPPSPGWLAGVLILQFVFQAGAAWDAGRLPPVTVSGSSRVVYALAVLAVLVLGLFAAKLVLRSGPTWGRNYWIPSQSGVPTLLVGDYIVVDCRPIQGIERGDTVVFHPPAGYRGEKTDLVKRIVGVGGDTVEVRDGVLWLNDKPQVETYVLERMENDFPPHRVAENHYFMLGDNRNNSFDSRFYGDVPRENWVGRVAWIFWSKDLGRIGTAANLGRK